MRAARVYFVLAVVEAFLFSVRLPAAALFRIEVVGLDALGLVLVGTVLELTVLLFEIPTGAIADLVSRRLSTWIGFALIGVGFMLEVLVPTFASVLCAQVIWGLGATFTSGARSAWLADEVGPGRLGEILMRGRQYALLAGFFATALGIALGTLALAIPLVLSGASALGLALFLLVAMPERARHDPASTPGLSLAALAGTVRGGAGLIRRRPHLLALVGVAVLLGGMSEPVDRLWELLVATGFPGGGLLGVAAVVWVGGIRMAGQLGGMALTAWGRRHLDLTRVAPVRRSLVASSLIMMAALAGFAFFEQIALAALCFVALQSVRYLAEPIIETWTNRQLEECTRATVLSMQAQADALGQITFGPALGGVGRSLGVRAALLAAAALLAPVATIFWRSLSKDERARGEPGRH